MCDGSEEIAPPRDAGQRGAALKALLLFSVRDVAKMGAGGRSWAPCLCVRLASRLLQHRAVAPVGTPWMWTLAFSGNPLGGRVVLGVVVANCSGDHFREMRSWWHSSEALNRLLRGSFGRSRSGSKIITVSTRPLSPSKINQRQTTPRRRAYFQSR